MNIDAISFEFGNGRVYCVGNKAAIRDIHNYYNLREGHIVIDNFIERIIFDRIYCYIDSFLFKEKRNVARLNHRLKKEKLNMDYDAFLEALSIVNPEKVIGILKLSDADMKEIRETTCWKEVFEF